MHILLMPFSFHHSLYMLILTLQLLIASPPPPPIELQSTSYRVFPPQSMTQIFVSLKIRSTLHFRRSYIAPDVLAEVIHAGLLTRSLFST